MLGIIFSSHLPHPSSVNTLWIITVQFKNTDSQALIIYLTQNIINLFI